MKMDLALLHLLQTCQTAPLDSPAGLLGYKGRAVQGAPGSGAGLQVAEAAAAAAAVVQRVSMTIARPVTFQRGSKARQVDAAAAVVAAIVQTATTLPHLAGRIEMSPDPAAAVWHFLRTMTTTAAAAAIAERPCFQRATTRSLAAVYCRRQLRRQS